MPPNRVSLGPYYKTTEGTKRKLRVQYSTRKSKKTSLVVLRSKDQTSPKRKAKVVSIRRDPGACETFPRGWGGPKRKLLCITAFVKLSDQGGSADLSSETQADEFLREKLQPQPHEVRQHPFRFDFLFFTSVVNPCAPRLFIYALVTVSTEHVFSSPIRNSLVLV